MTYRQFAEWLAKGNGQCRINGDERCTTSCTYVTYNSAQDSNECNEYYEIRRWGSDEWVKPTIDIYNEDCRKSQISKNGKQ